jgi:hypothetical protein
MFPYGRIVVSSIPSAGIPERNRDVALGVTAAIRQKTDQMQLVIAAKSAGKKVKV